MDLSSKPILGVPEPTVRRLPNYLSYLKIIRETGKEYISAPHIAKDLKLDSTQVTKDLAYTQVNGKTKIGYQINELIEALEEFLGYNRTNIAFLVGAGNLGSALIKYNGFLQSGLKIVAAFDIDKDKIWTKVGEIEIFPFAKFQNLVERLHCVIGIITTPADATQSIADKMIESGIKAIWNFTPTIIRTSEDVIIENTSIYSNLAVIINKLDSQKIHAE